MENKTQQGEEVNTTNEMAADTQVNEAAATENPISDTESGQKDSELIKLQAQVNESKDKYLRLYSEFENFRRRTAKEKLDMIQSANEQLLKALLPVLDDFERAEKSWKEKADKDAEGFVLIQNKFKKILDQFGVKVMDLQPGAEFNADTQEAITQIPAPDPSLKGKVVDVIEKGYLLNDKVIRFAKVVVGN